MRVWRAGTGERARRPDALGAVAPGHFPLSATTPGVDHVRVTKERAMAETFWTRRVDHVRLYTTILVVLGLSTCLTIPLGLFVWYQRLKSPGPYA